MNKHRINAASGAFESHVSSDLHIMTYILLYIHTGIYTHSYTYILRLIYWYVSMCMHILLYRFCSTCLVLSTWPCSPREKAPSDHLYNPNRLGYMITLTYYTSKGRKGWEKYMIYRYTWCYCYVPSYGLDTYYIIKYII